MTHEEDIKHAQIITMIVKFQDTMTNRMMSNLEVPEESADALSKSIEIMKSALNSQSPEDVDFLFNFLMSSFEDL